MEILGSILNLLAGAGVFIVAMNILSSNLEKACGNAIKKILTKISNNKIAGIGIGALVTAIIHSSAATTVMVIGLVNANVMSLAQATSIIMGANIGTTITGLIVSLSSLNINAYFTIFAFIGCILMFSKKDKIKSIGGVLAGLGMIFIGLSLMSGSFDNESIKQFSIDLFSSVNFPLLLIVIGMVLTALLQSSTAMTGLIIVMVSSGAIPDISTGLFIILGTNIGTCVSALISTVGTNANAKRAGLIHLAFNVIGTVIFTIILWIFKEPIVGFLEELPINTAMQIALFHLFFNVVTALILLPFSKYLVLVSTKLVKDKDLEEKQNLTKFLDDRFLKAPHIAQVQCKKQIDFMGDLAKENIIRSMNAILNSSISEKEEIEKTEESIDYINIELTKYLIKLSGNDKTTNEQIGSYYHVVNDIERVGDHAQNFMDIVCHMKDQELEFGPQALNELKEMFETVLKLFDLCMSDFNGGKAINVKEIDKLEKYTDELKVNLSASHYERLAQGKCTIETGSNFTSIVNGLERVADHLVNIAYSITNPTGD